MQNFIVLGIIPGTSIQLTFNFWLYVAIVSVSLPIIKNVWQRRETARTYFVALLISRFIAQYRLPA
jgi:hypothetical protein